MHAHGGKVRICTMVKCTMHMHMHAHARTGKVPTVEKFACPRWKSTHTHDGKVHMHNTLAKCSRCCGKVRARRGKAVSELSFRREDFGCIGCELVRVDYQVIPRW